MAQEKEVGPTVVPHAERELAERKKISGPVKNKGIKPVKPVGSVALGSEFSALAGRQRCARELAIEPGGVVALRQHDLRPGMACILEGVILEHRSDQAQPLRRKKADAAFEQTGFSHWWENKSRRPVRALVVDIVPVGQK